MKLAIKIYLENEDIDKLKRKASQAGFIGKGSISRYLEKVAREPSIFLDENLKSFLEVVKLKPSQ